MCDVYCFVLSYAMTATFTIRVIGFVCGFATRSSESFVYFIDFLTEVVSRDL